MSVAVGGGASNQIFIFGRDPVDPQGSAHHFFSESKYRSSKGPCPYWEYCGSNYTYKQIGARWVVWPISRRPQWISKTVSRLDYTVYHAVVLSPLYKIYQRLSLPSCFLLFAPLFCFILQDKHCLLMQPKYFACYFIYFFSHLLISCRSICLFIRLSGSLVVSLFVCMYICILVCLLVLLPAYLSVYLSFHLIHLLTFSFRSPPHHSSFCFLLSVL